MDIVGRKSEWYKAIGSGFVILGITTKLYFKQQRWSKHRIYLTHFFSHFVWGFWENAGNHCIYSKVTLMIYIQVNHLLNYLERYLEPTYNHDYLFSLFKDKNHCLNLTPEISAIQYKLLHFCLVWGTFVSNSLSLYGDTISRVSIHTSTIHIG